MSMTGGPELPSQIDTSVAHSARVWNYEPFPSSV